MHKKRQKCANFLLQYAFYKATGGQYMHNLEQVQNRPYCISPKATQLVNTQLITSLHNLVEASVPWHFLTYLLLYLLDDSSRHYTTRFFLFYPSESVKMYKKQKFHQHKTPTKNKVTGCLPGLDETKLWCCWCPSLELRYTHLLPATQWHTDSQIDD